MRAINRIDVVRSWKFEKLVVYLNSVQATGFLINALGTTASEIFSVLRKHIDKHPTHSDIEEKTMSRHWKHTYCSAVAMLAVCLSMTGCGASAVKDQPELGTVRGTISLEGTPLPGVSVTFQPVDGRPASGVTNTEGEYELVYIRNTMGCKTGTCHVSIANDAEVADELEQEGDGFEQVVSDTASVEIPAKYNTKTELTANVQPGENTFDFDLAES